MDYKLISIFLSGAVSISLAIYACFCWQWNAIIDPTKVIRILSNKHMIGGKEHNTLRSKHEISDVDFFQAFATKLLPVSDKVQIIITYHINYVSSN